MYIHRELEALIEPFIKRKEVIAILGPRQTGKTTLLQYLVNDFRSKGKKVKYVTFERPGDLELFNTIEDFKNLYQQFDIVIIDEFQYAKDGGQKLKYLFDTTETKYIISGSSSLELTFHTGKYMVGRMFNFTLSPFSFREFLFYKDKDLFRILNEKVANPFEYSLKNAFGEEIHGRLEKYFEEYLLYGGYPAVVLAKTIEEKFKILESILTNYLLKDISSLLRLASEDKLLLLTKLLANQIGNLINYQELSLSTGISYREVKKYIEILEKTYIVSRLKPYFTNRRTELVKNPKVYFVDTGFRNFLISDFRILQQRADYGALVENYAVTAIKRDISIPDQINFWRTKAGAEVDMVLKKGGKIIPIEVKYSLKSSPGKSLYSFLEKFGPGEFFILTKSLVDKKKIQNCILKFLPVYYF